MLGPLKDIKIVEMAGIGPGPFCAMMLADMGARVIRVGRSSVDRAVPGHRFLNRGRPSVRVDLKTADGIETVLRLVARADALIEGFRPGVMERLGLGPVVCFGRNPRIIVTTQPLVGYKRRAGTRLMW